MKSDNVTAIGKRLKDVRRTLKVQQKEAAAILSTSASYISEIEAGKANPGPEFFLKFYNAFNVNLNYIFLGIGEMFLGDQDKPEPASYNFNEDIDSVDKVLWLMKNSSYVKNTILSFTSKLVLDNTETVKRSIDINSKKESN